MGGTRAGTRSIVRVALLTDHRLCREALVTLLAAHPGIRVVLHGDDPAQILHAPESASLDVLLVDVELAGRSTVSTITTVRRTLPHAAVVVVTMHRDAALRRTLLAAGATAFVTKDLPSRYLVDQVLRAGDTTRLPEVQRGPDPQFGLVDVLSPRETEVLRLVAAARSNPEIAAELHLATGTVKRHVFTIYRKLDVTSRVAAITAARRLGILD